MQIWSAFFALFIRVRGEYVDPLGRNIQFNYPENILKSQWNIEYIECFQKFFFCWLTFKPLAFQLPIVLYMYVPWGRSYRESISPLHHNV